MDALELLWQLQNQDYEIHQLEKRLREVEEDEDLISISDTIGKMEVEIKDLEIQIEKLEKKLRKNNFLLQNLNSKLQEVEKALYGGNIKDIQQLELLNGEQNFIKEEIDIKEIEIISQMEEVEVRRNELDQLKKELDKVQLKYKNIKKEHEQLGVILKNNMKEKQIAREKIVEKLSEKTYTKYEQLKELKGFALAKLVDDKCGGCNVFLPTILIDRLKFQRELVSCENCGRLLYYSRNANCNN